MEVITMSYKGTYEGKSLKHYRTKGSRNGYSKDPNYTPIGEKAKYPMGALPDRNLSTAPTPTVAQPPRRMLPTTKIPQYNAAAQRGQIANKKATAQAAAQARVGAKNQGMHRAMANRSARNVGGVSSTTKGQPNKGDYGKPKSQQQLVEERRIAGGSQVGNSQNETNRRRIQGSTTTKNAAQRQKETEERRIKGGNYGSTARKSGINSQYDAQAAQRQKATNRTNYRAMVNRRKAEENRAGITANKAAAGARRIAGSKLGSKYEDRGDGNFRRAGEYLKNRRIESAAKEAATGTAKAAKSLVKKGRKKVKKLMKRMFG
jgi:hypothetical protein